MKVCNHCHIPKLESEYYKRSALSGGLQHHCKECAKAARQRYRADPVKYARELAGRRLWRKNNPAKAKEQDRRRNIRACFGITPEQYDAMLQAQHGLCAICKQPETTILNGKVKRLAVDHCHDTGVVRALLCTKCNTAIGLLNHSPELARAALAYLLLCSPSDTQLDLSCAPLDVPQAAGL